MSVAIVGGGPVGLMCALGLARQGIAVDLFEAEADIVYSPRAIGYAWPILQALRAHGLLDDMIAAGSIEHERCWRVLASSETIVFDHSAVADDTDTPFSLTLGQHLLARVLLNHLERKPSARIHWNSRVSSVSQCGDHVELTIERGDGVETMDAAWTIGTDGGRSTVRRSIGLPMEGFTWDRRFVATDIHYDFAAHGWRSCYLIDPVHGAVVYQLNEPGLWRFTYAEDRALPVEGALDRMPAFLRAALPGDEAYALQNFSPYNMHQRTAPRYRQGRVLLAGDAAHLTNPTSGFGLMGGLYDAFLLVEALGAVVRGEIGEEVLDRYATARRNVFLDVISPVSIESLRLCFDSTNPERLAWDIAQLRERIATPARMRASLWVPAALETPSLLTGRTYV
ncbi:FAD-dependent oxidoreductase [Sphingomonas colocasiae]|uniref:FAD-dependent monooxygenase n=1 Tax=Sphingomonas colocasiae TaxID=1848973 RepID=A0ABS7PV95_9SPHN|nr:NAD(P)/FAD-dependent oxidoreductase [Sphingomonas colocasiae]MBY8824297.1 FAD-dependent monooxygenase [Sphingomonas colocasiae]